MTKTGSGRGCGDDWPLCNGKFVPAYTLESLIEYSHRFVTGIVGIIVVVTFWHTWRYLRHHREAAAYAGGTLLFTIIQALMGAAAVKWPQQPAVMALHFGISLLAVASSMLLVAWCYRVDKKTEPASSRHLPKWISIAAWGIWIYCYGVVYLGAYIRHTGTEGACMGWPLCNGELIPYLYGASGIVFAHRAAAAVLLLLLRIAYPCSPRLLQEPALRLENRNRGGPRAHHGTDCKRRTAHRNDRRRECLFICQPSP